METYRALLESSLLADEGLFGLGLEQEGKSFMRCPICWGRSRSIYIPFSVKLYMTTRIFKRSLLLDEAVYKLPMLSWTFFLQALLKGWGAHVLICRYSCRTVHDQKKTAGIL